MNKEFFRSRERDPSDILRYGNAEEKQKLIYDMFTGAEKVVDPEKRRYVHQFNFQFINQFSGKPEEYRTKERLETKNIINGEAIDGFIPYGYRIPRTPTMNGKTSLLSIDFYRFEKQFLEFCDLHHFYSNHEDTLSDFGYPKEITSLLMAVQLTLFKTFGFPGKKSIAKYAKKYYENERIFLSDFIKGENVVSAGVCEEFNAFAHELISLTGIVRPLRIAGYLKIDRDGPKKRVLPLAYPTPSEKITPEEQNRIDELLLQDPGHAFSLLINPMGDSESSYLFDGINYWLKPDNNNMVSFLAPFVEKLSKNQADAFLFPKKEPVIIDKPQMPIRFYYGAKPQP